MEYSEKKLTEIIQNNLRVYYEIEARDVVFRQKFNNEERREISPWIMAGRSKFQQEEFNLWVKLHAKIISETKAIELMTDLMELYYKQKYPLR